MRRVIIESPYRATDRATVELYERYARACLRDCLKRGEAPFASHLLYTQVLYDAIPKERELGMAAGFCWGERADATVVYGDCGITSGMRRGIAEARENGRPVETRWLGWGTRLGPPDEEMLLVKPSDTVKAALECLDQAERRAASPGWVSRVPDEEEDDSGY